MAKFFPLRLRIPRFPVAVQFTREGVVFVVLTLAIGAAAVNTGNNVLYLIFSIMLGLIVVSGLVSRRILRGMQATVEFPPNLFSGVKNNCYLTVANRKKSIPALGIRFIIGEGSFPRTGRYFFYIPAGTKAHGFAPIVFPRRGIFELKEMELQTRFPFSFFVKIRRFFPEQKVRVYPQIYKLPDDFFIRMTQGLLLESPFRGESHQLLHLRDYSSFDSSKRIHWKASAKAEKFLVKEFQKEQGRELVVYFDCYPDSETGNDILEAALSLAASLAFLVQEKGLQANFVFADRQFEVGPRDVQMIPLLDHLSEIKAERPLAIPDLSTADQNVQSLVICSRSISRSFSVPDAREIFVEDAFPLMKQPVEMAG